MSKGLKLRSAPTLYTNQSFRVDRDNLLIRDVIAMQAGVEALGHECQADGKTLSMMAELGNAQTRGLRMRFGHPGMSENAAGKKIGLAKNFRVDGDGLRHDMHLLPEARDSPVFSRDPLEYIFNIAENHPSELAESVVMNTRLVWTMPDGAELDLDDYYLWRENVETDDTDRPKEALTPLPIIRPLAFYYVDVVNEGALTHEGLFEPQMFQSLFGGTANAYAEEVFDLVDRWREEYNIPLERVPDKVHQVMQRYLHARGMNDMAKKYVGPGTGSTVTRKFEEGAKADDPLLKLPPEEPENEADDDLDGATAAAEETAAQLDEEDQAAEAPDDGNGDTVSGAEFRELQQKFAALEERFEKVVNLTVLNTKNIQRLKGDVQRIDGEPTVQMAVPRTGSAAMGARMKMNGAPPTSLAKQVPGSVSGRGHQAVPDFDTDPEAATLAAYLSRQQSPR